MNYLIIYSDGFSTCQRGPFETLEEAQRVFEGAPIPPKTTAYLVDAEGNDLSVANGDDEDEDE